MYKETLKKKIYNENKQKIESDNEYFFAVGQLVKFMAELDPTVKKHNVVRPFLKADDTKEINSKLREMFIKFEDKIHKDDIKFRNMFEMIIEYSFDKEKVDIIEEIILEGFIHSSL